MFKAHNTNYITDSYVNTVYVLQIRVIRELRWEVHVLKSRLVLHCFHVKLTRYWLFDRQTGFEQI